MPARVEICPFCSHAGEMSLSCQRFVDHEAFWVQCGKCFARGPATRFPHSVLRREEAQELAIARWNARRPDVRRAVEAEFVGRKGLLSA